MISKAGFRYGETQIEVDLQRVDVLNLPPMRSGIPVPDVTAAVTQALSSPLGTPPLRELARDRRDAILLVPDRTRSIPLPAILPPVLAELEAGGLGPEQVTIMVAVGTHRPMTREELRRHLGPVICSRFRVLNHDWQSVDGLVDLGQTPGGTPVVVNRRYVEADLKLAVGAVKPHVVVGWGGGAKIVQPGVGGGATTGATHWASASYMGREVTGQVDTPMRREIEAAVDLSGLDFLLNGATNLQGEMIGFCAGDFRLAFRRCVKMALEANDYISTLDPPVQRADILLSGTAGRDMWNGGSAGMVAAEHLLRPGGTVVQFAPCSEGVSQRHPEVARWGYRPYREVRSLVEAGEIADLVAAAHMVHSGRVLDELGCQCILFSDGLSREQVERLDLVWAPSPQAAVELALKSHGLGATAHVIGTG
jgi:nickel-dependent lactate racemase